jgi:uncharacterized protein YggE
MQSTLTIKVRTVVLTIAIMLAVLAAYLAGASGPGKAAAAAADETATADVNRIVMAGSGDVEGVPDELSFSVSVRNTSSDVSTALDHASGAMHRVLHALRRAGVERKNTQTTALSVHAEYNYVDGARVLAGYQASQRMTVLVTSLADAGDAISAAVDAGGDAVTVGNVQLKISDMDALLGKARADAVADAKAKAEQYAKAAGASLGDVTSIHEVARSGGRVVYGSAASFDAANALRGVAIRPGRSTVKVTVSITWALG